VRVVVFDLKKGAAMIDAPQRFQMRRKSSHLPIGNTPQLVIPAFAGMTRMEAIAPSAPAKISVLGDAAATRRDPES
jgi:hypothetical protein